MFEYLYAERCRHCQQYVTSKSGAHTLCNACWQQTLARPPFHAVLPLAAANGSAGGTIVIGCGTAYDGAIKKLVYKLKYDDDRLVLKDMNVLLEMAFEELAAQIAIDRQAVLMPIPLHKSRLKQRGFNQAEDLAAHLSRVARHKLERGTLVRVKNTKAQHGLSKPERRANMTDAFSIRRPVMASHVVLVDDIYTSGTTLAEAARALLSGGVPKVSAVAVARVL